MNRLASFLVGVLSGTLEPDERDAVLGDWIESGASPGRMLAELTGLIVRRHAGDWSTWHPWLALAGIVVPIGALLSHCARWWADSSAVPVFMYVGNWTWGYVATPGARADLAAAGLPILLHSLALVAWSWTAGVALGTLSRRAVAVTALLFAMTVLGATAGSTTVARAFGGNTAVFALALYSQVLPWLFKGVLVLLPAFAGMRRGLRLTPLAPRGAVLLFVAVMALTVWTGRALEASLVFGRGTLPAPGLDGIVGTADDVSSYRLLPILMIWPAAYLLLSAGRQGRRPPEDHSCIAS